MHILHSRSIKQCLSSNRNNKRYSCLFVDITRYSCLYHRIVKQCLTSNRNKMYSRLYVYRYIDIIIGMGTYLVERLFGSGRLFGAVRLFGS